MNATVRASRHTRRASASHSERSEFSEWFADAHLKSDMAAAKMPSDRSDRSDQSYQSDISSIATTS